MDKKQINESIKMASASDFVHGIIDEKLSTLFLHDIGSAEDRIKYTTSDVYNTVIHGERVTLRPIESISVPYDIPDVFTMYPSGVINDIITDVLGDVNYVAMMTRNYISLYNITYDATLTNDPTKLPLIESVFYGLVIPYSDIPLNMNHDYRYGDLLRTLFASRLKRGV